MLGWLPKLSGTGVADFQVPTMSQNTLFWCPGTKPCFLSLCYTPVPSTPIHCGFLRLLLRALHRTINRKKRDCWCVWALVSTTKCRMYNFQLMSGSSRALSILRNCDSRVLRGLWLGQKLWWEECCKVNRSTDICKVHFSAYMQSHLPHVVTTTADQYMGSL